MALLLFQEIDFISGVRGGGGGGVDERDAFNPYHRYLELRTSWEVINADAPLPVFLMPERKAANCPGPRTEPGQSRTALHRLTRSLQQHAALLQATHHAFPNGDAGKRI